MRSAIRSLQRDGDPGLCTHRPKGRSSRESRLVPECWAPDPRHGPNPLGEFFMGTKGKLTHVVSERPRDISRWRALDHLPPFGTYVSG